MTNHDLSLDMERINSDYSKPRLEALKVIVNIEPDDMKRDHLLTDLYLYNQALDGCNSARMHNALQRVHRAGYRPLFNKGMYITDLERRVEDAGR